MHRQLQRTYLTAWDRINAPQRRGDGLLVEGVVLGGQAPESLDRKVARIQRSGSPLGRR